VNIDQSPVINAAAQLKYQIGLELRIPFTQRRITLWANCTPTEFLQRLYKFGLVSERSDSVGALIIFANGFSMHAGRWHFRATRA
jgi:hypothetical protein